MTLPVSSTFLMAETADTVQVAKRVYLVRGNYASSAAYSSSVSASSSDASNNYPAAGAIDGDRTEINIGAASAADNGVGLYSWRSANTPSAGSPETLTIDMGVSRTFNWLKLFNLSTDPLTSYKISWSADNITYHDFAGTADQGSGTGYNGATQGLDSFDFSVTGTTFTARYLKITIYGTKNADAANVVEFEVYYKVDVTDRLLECKVNRQRDWKQVNPMAASCDLVFHNADRFFSPSHVPTSTETTNGFFNSELTNGLGIIIQEGFYYPSASYYSLGYGQGNFGDVPTPAPYGGGGVTGGAPANPEYATVFVGTIDELKISSKKGVCAITGRDGMKGLLNMTWSSGLKTNIDIGAAVKYLCNIANVSNYTMNIAMTNLLVPNFFIFETVLLDAIQQLVQAAGNASFWFDESGTTQFANLLTNSTSSHTDLMWTLQDNTKYTGLLGSNGTITLTGTQLVVQDGPGSAHSIAYFSQNEVQGWQFTIAMNGNGGTVDFATVSVGSANNGGYGQTNGYNLAFNSVNGNLNVTVNNVGTTLGTFTPPNGNSLTTYTILRFSDGTFLIFANGLLVLNVQDTTFTSGFAYFGIEAIGQGGGSQNITLLSYSLLNTNLTISYTSNSASDWTINFASSSIDQGSVASEGQLWAGFYPTISPITYQTRTSVDGMSWGAWSSVTLNSYQQGPITSTTHEFIEYQFFFHLIGPGGASLVNAPIWQLYYVILTWTPSVTSASVRSFTYLSTLCDIQETISDSLSGDSSIINYIEVDSEPVYLIGSSSTQWQATVGSPPAIVSLSNPLVVSTGTMTIQAVVPGGMDTSQMSLLSGGNSLAISITFGTAVGHATISYVHPTKPIITLTITTAGTITALSLVGVGFSSTQTQIQAIAQNMASQVKNGRRAQTVSNNFIPNNAIATLIANTMINNFATITVLIEDMLVPLAPSIQIADLIALTDYNLDISSQIWKVSGIEHVLKMDAGGSNPEASTKLKALLYASS